MWRSTLLALLLAANLNASSSAATVPPLTADGPCGGTHSCRSVLEAWNAAAWDDVVDDGFNTGTLPLAAVRWYTTEGTCTGFRCTDQLHPLDDQPLDAATHRFVGVTDELSNVLLAFSIGNDQARFQKLQSFVEMLRLPAINNLQCWKYVIDGQNSYVTGADVCVATRQGGLYDSASDASLRILGAYGVACARQRSGDFATTGFSNYCAAYVTQGDAIWGRGTVSHGEIRHLANGEAFLASGYANQEFAPTADTSFRPDYYELQFLLDYADYADDATMRSDVADMLNDYVVSTGTNHIHTGLSGHFNSTTTSFSCDTTPEAAFYCTPAPFMDNVNTWRAVPALSGLLVSHPEAISRNVRSELFDYWWNHFAGGSPSFGAAAGKPMEIYSNAIDGSVRQQEHSYKSLSMWLPLGAAYDGTYVAAAMHELVDVKYDWAAGRFYGAAYYGAYFSQFAQRAIGVTAGLLSPSSYTLPPPSTVSAEAASESTITVTWSAVASADSYEVWRSGDGRSFALAGTTTGTTFNDSTAIAGSAYLYEVRTRKASRAPSRFSAPDLATAVIFTDSTLVPGATPVRAAHVLQLRTAVNAARTLAGLSVFAFSDPAPSVVRATHVIELRSALGEARAALNLPVTTYTDPGLAVGTTIRASHVVDLRGGVR